MSLDDIIRIDLSASATPVDTALTTIPLLVAKEQPDWDDDKVAHVYSTVADMLADGFESDSPTVAYARLLLGQGDYPGTFLVGKKAGAALATSDLDAIVQQDNSWYGLCVVQATDDEIQTAASWLSGQRKLLIAATATANNGDGSSTTSLAAVLKNKSIRRCALMFSPGSADKGIDAAWLGGQLPATPGTNNWSYVTLDGVATDNLTTSQLRATIGVAVDETLGNNANVYITRAGSGNTQYGRCADGSWIDNVIGEDWIVFNLQSAIFGVLKNNRKVPYTDRGVALLLAAVHQVMNQGQANGLIANDPAYVVTAPAVSTVATADKIARRAPLITVACTLQGAINSVRLVINVSP